MILQGSFKNQNDKDLSSTNVDNLNDLSVEQKRVIQKNILSENVFEHINFQKLFLLKEQLIANVRFFIILSVKPHVNM